MQFTVHNMVITVEFSNRLDLDLIASKLEGAEYAPDQFPGLVYRIKKPKASFLIFSSGKMNCAGVTSIKDAKNAIAQMLKKLKRMGFKIFEPKIEIQNVVASTELKKRVELERVLELEGTEYEPEQFPGLVYRTKKGVAFLIFSGGKIVCVGARSIKQAKESLDNLLRKLRSIKALKD